MTDCGNHGNGGKKKFQRILAGFLVISFILLVTALMVWAILRPKKPRFVLRDVTVRAFNASVPNFLTSNFAITVSSRNPNDRIGVYYDRLDVYATYRSQQITFRTRIPPTYQGHEEVNVWSPIIDGTTVPVAPYNSLALVQDEAAGVIRLLIKIDGRVRFKLGTFITKRYHIHVKCLATIPFGSTSSCCGGAGIIVGDNAVKFQLVERCSVSI
ncbi:hypothetical protein SAY87_026712 [Trapa incisa]|uniref:Late embryogenesis abundant protein LEA-2 subgroup domain-containing protein n=1 Tax=Trapa incisa TaxID=236973 RepID=A0AAN7GRY6_9MYRT|nr:hypothetical protein SAY87_026712 [Trapa incisa]